MDKFAARLGRLRARGANGWSGSSDGGATSSPPRASPERAISDVILALRAGGAGILILAGWGLPSFRIGGPKIMASASALSPKPPVWPRPRPLLRNQLGPAPFKTGHALTTVPRVFFGTWTRFRPRKRSAKARASAGAFGSALPGNVGVERERAPSGDYFVWLDPAVVNRIAALCITTVAQWPRVEISM